MNDADFELIEKNLKRQLENERQLNQQILGKLDAYENVIRMILNLLIEGLR